MSLLDDIEPFRTGRPKRNRIALQTLILRLLAEGRGPGLSYVQVGANDGRMADPVFRIATENGWQGLLIEPHPVYFAELARHHAENPRMRPVQVGISDRDVTRPLFYVSDEARPQFPRWVAGCASLDRAWVEAALDRAASKEGIARRPGDLAQVDVRLRPLADVLAEEGVDAADLLVIDVEGHERAVLDGFDLGRLGASLVIVECQAERADDAAWIADRLDRADFAPIRLGHDIYGIHRTRFRAPLAAMLVWIGYRTLTDAEVEA